MKRVYEETPGKEIQRLSKREVACETVKRPVKVNERRAKYQE